MKLKTALELLGDDGEKILDGILCTKGEERDECTICKKSMRAFELVARRAREETREAMADAADACAKVGIVTAETAMYIRKIWVQS